MSVKCRDCKHFSETVVFELCLHPSSKYVVAELEDFHTATHMRRHACTETAVNFAPIDQLGVAGKDVDIEPTRATVV